MATAGPTTLKNFIKHIALQTLLRDCDGNIDNIDMKSEAEDLTELEELDLHYDFGFRRNKKEHAHFDIRRVFDSDSDDEYNIDMMLKGG